MSPDTITIASQWTDNTKIVYSSGNPTVKETRKEKLLRKKKEKMDSLPEKVKRKIGKWRV